MDKQSTDHKEETLVAMLASFRKEACYPVSYTHLRAHET